jgi:hypothetical protein
MAWLCWAMAWWCFQLALRRPCYFKRFVVYVDILSPLLSCRLTVNSLLSDACHCFNKSSKKKMNTDILPWHYRLTDSHLHRFVEVWWRHHSCLQMVYWRQELVRYFAIVWWRQECLILCNSMMKARMSDPLWAPLIRSMIALKSCRASFGVARTRSRSLPSKCYCGVFSSIS